MVNESNQKIVEILENLWAKNKAKGLLAQTIFTDEIKNGLFGKDGAEKTMPGCWLLSPKSPDFYKFRFCFSIHSSMGENNNPDDLKTLFGPRYRPYFAIAEFMNSAGVGFVYVIPSSDGKVIPLQEIRNKDFSKISWSFYSFENGAFVARNPVEFFGRWEGERGRPGHGGSWDQQIKDKILSLDGDILTELLLNELFYTGFLKSILKKPVNDPYDVDSFLISISQKYIFPMEIKEKFPAVNGKEKFFGIDAGRVMMLLRLCLPNDANAIYLIREVEEVGSKFVGWKFITLSDIVMTSGWNLQAGGPGMGGQSTQTIKLPYGHFKDFTKDVISEDNLKKLGCLPKDIRFIARQFGDELASKFHL